MKRPTFARRKRQPVQELIGQVKRIYRVIGTFRRPPQLGVYALSTFFVAVAYSMVPDLAMRKRLALRILAAAMVVLIVFSSRRSALGSSSASRAAGSRKS